MTVFDAAGERIPRLQAFALRDVPPTELAEHEARASALLPAPELRFSPVYWSPSRDEPVITLAFPMGDPVEGFVAAELSLRALADMLGSESGGVQPRLLRRRCRWTTGGGGGLGRHRRRTRSVPALGRAHAATFRNAPLTEAFHVGNFGEGQARVVGAVGGAAGRRLGDRDRAADGGRLQPGRRDEAQTA